MDKRGSDVFGEATPLPEEDARLIEQYKLLNTPVDALIVSGLIEDLVAAVKRQGDMRSRDAVVARLLNLRKAARLPRLGSPSTSGPAAVTISASSAEEATRFARALLERGVRSVRIASLSSDQFTLSYFDYD